MDKRKISLIKSGMRLFADKGFHKTSVQDIASNANISKGAFYLLFDSKESFIVTAITYFHNELTERTEAVKKENLRPKEHFIKQIDVVTSYVFKYREFIMMLFQDDVSLGRRAEQLFQKIKLTHFTWLKENIQTIYDHEADPYLIDAVIQLEGILSSYFKWIVIDDIPIDRDRIGDFIIARLEDLIHGMHLKDDDPLVNKEDISVPFNIFREKHANEQEIRSITTSMKKTIQQLSISKDQKSELIEVVDMLQNEQKQVIIQGLLAHLQPYESLHGDCERITKLFQIELL